VKFPPGMWGVPVVLCCMTGVAVAQSDELDREITRLKKEITRVEAQRENEARQMKTERTEFRAYQERTAARISSINHQTDSVRAVQQRTEHRNDSLRAALGAVQAGIREQELLGKNVRSVIASALKKLQYELPDLPPLITEQYSGPVSYLLTELEAGSVENTEALYRFMRLVQDLRTVSQEIQVVEGASPVAQLRGSVYRLRIGAVFEAVVDAEGRKAFLWTSAGERTDTVWVPAGNETTAGALLKAVRIREGKTVPELVDLPIAGRGERRKEAADER
jgi:hypothetical protein